MSTDLTLYELTGSPNNVKARIALGFKGLEYERQPVELDGFPGDRAVVVALSRQPRLPVLKAGDAVVFDSGAIMRYLEANFADTPPLFSTDYEEFGEIERWELYARTHLAEPIDLIEHALVHPPGTEDIARANQLLDERTAPIEERLASTDFLVGGRLTAADVACAGPLYLADLTAENAAVHPISAFFHANLELADGRPRTRSWVRRVVAFDRVMGRREPHTPS